MNSSRILCCDSCQKEKADILCVSCTSQKLKEIRFQNEYRYKEINGTSLECPRNSMTESLLTLQISSKTQSTRNVNELSKLNAENNTLKSILKKIQDRKKALQEHVTNLKEHNSKNEQKLQGSRNQDKEAQESNKELMKSKLRCFRNIYNIHHAFPKLQVPLRLRIVQDKFFEATQSGIIESQHFSLDMSRFATLKGMNAKHAKLISEVLTRIAEFVIYISEVLFVNLPVKMQKSEGLYWLSFHNDPSKVYQLHFDENVHEGNFFQAISLLFTNFLYLSRMINVKLKIPINLESSSENDILNLNPLLNKLTEDNDGFQGKQEELENSEIPLDIINLGKRSNSLENEFEIIEDTDSV